MTQKERLSMDQSVKTNKQGQELGRKGRNTRRHLMEATERLLRTHSPVDLTAVAISKEAKISSAAFYLYFEDVKNVLLALSEAAAAEMADVHQILEEPWDVIEPDLTHAKRVVAAFHDVYDRHRAVLRFCNLEADRGDAQFEAVRLAMLVPFIKEFSERIYAASGSNGELSRGDAYGEAIVFVAAMERNAGSDPKQVESAIGVERLQEAMARLIAWRFSAGGAHQAARMPLPAARPKSVTHLKKNTRKKKPAQGKRPEMVPEV